MSKVEFIEHEIEQTLSGRVGCIDAESWDRRFEADAKDGSLMH